MCTIDTNIIIGTSDVEQVAEDNFAEVVEQGALQLQERLAKKSNEASPKLRRNRQNSQSISTTST